MTIHIIFEIHYSAPWGTETIHIILGLILIRPIALFNSIFICSAQLPSEAHIPCPCFSLGDRYPLNDILYG